MKLRYQMEVQHVANFWAAVPVGKDAMRYNGVMSLNETAKDIFVLLQQEKSEAEIVSTLLKDYDVTEAELRQHVQDFLQRLRAENLLIEP